MQLTKETVEILKNFSIINPSIVISEGNSLLTHSTDRGGIIATATINEFFPKKFGIYELGKFINSLSLVEDYNIDFADTQMTIKNKHKRLKYTYSDPNHLLFRTDLAPPNLDYAEHTSISARDFMTLRKSAGALNLDQVRIQAMNGKVYIKTAAKNSRDEYSVLTDTTTEHEFNIIYPITRFSSLMTLDYEISINKIGFARLKNDRVTYWIAPTNDSEKGTLK